MIRRVQRVWETLLLLLTNPTSLMAGLFLILQLFAVCLVSLLSPILVRSWALPTSIETARPLDLTFDTCTDQLHGVCSFPTATIDLNETPLFSPNVRYEINVNINFAETEAAMKLGVFNNVLRILDAQNNIIREFHKATYVKKANFIYRTIRFFLFPLYWVGLFDEGSAVYLAMAKEYHEIAPAHKLTFQLQNRFAQVETAEVLVSARLGLFRHLLYHWPLLSSLFLYVSTLSFLATIVLIRWGLTGNLPARSTVEDTVEVKEEEIVNSQTGTISSRASTQSSFEELVVPKKNQIEEDEFIPENVDELPECVPSLAFETALYEDNPSSEVRLRK